MTINSIMYNIVISSGDIAFRFLDYVKSRSDSHASESLATVCDINKSMLEVGKKRAARLRYETGEKHEMFERSNFNSGYMSVMIQLYGCKDLQLLEICLFH